MGRRMKAITFERPGDPREVLKIGEVPTPEPPPGHVLVRMLASPVNPSDLLYVAGHYTKSAGQWPAVGGFEGVGVVERSGGGVLGWLRKGKRVAVVSDDAGCWAEYAVIPARRVVPVPADIPDEQAACFFVNPATALAMTEHVLRIPKGATLLQSAAGSSLGRMVIRLGRRNGFRTINVVRRAAQADELKALGADEVIVGEGRAVAERVAELTAGAGVPYAIDAVGGETGSAVIASLARDGRALLYGLLTGQSITVDPRRVISTGVRIEGFWLGGWAKQQSVMTMLGLFRRIGRLMREGALATDGVITHALDEHSKAVAAAMEPGRTGKQVIRF